MSLFLHSIILASVSTSIKKHSNDDPIKVKFSLANCEYKSDICKTAVLYFEVRAGKHLENNKRDICRCFKHLNLKDRFPVFEVRLKTVVNPNKQNLTVTVTTYWQSNGRAANVRDEGQN